MNVAYLHKLERLRSALQNHSAAHLLHFATFPPVSPTQLDQLEEKGKFKLSDNLRAFYLTTNGFQLLWSYENTDTNYTHNQWSDYSNHHNFQGCINILPIEKWVFHIKNLNKDQLFSSVFSPLDKFGNGVCMSLFLENNTLDKLVMSGEDDHYTSSFSIDFAQYFDFLTISFGHIQSRLNFFDRADGYKYPSVVLPPAFLKKYNHQQLLHQIPLSETFTECDQLGANHLAIKTAMMQQMAQNAISITPSQAANILQSHHTFLDHGGAGGRWETVSAGGLVVGVYRPIRQPEQGEQAAFDLKNISNLDLGEAIIAFANFCGSYGDGTNFRAADLTGSLFTDSCFDNACFDNAYLKNVDFSRATLRHTSFKKAQLKQVDFENCDLTGANFEEATIINCSFRGALLKDIIR